MEALKLLMVPTAPRAMLKIIYHCCLLDPTKRHSFERISKELDKIRLTYRTTPNSAPISRRRSTSQKKREAPRSSLKATCEV